MENVGITGGVNGIHAPDSVLSLGAVTVAGASGPGIVAERINADHLTVTGNGGDGLRAEAVRLRCATVTGNGGADVASTEPPVLGDYVTCCGVSAAP